MTRSATSTCKPASGAAALGAALMVFAGQAGAAHSEPARAAQREPVPGQAVNATDVALTPTHDLNLKKDPIPPILLRARAAPYGDTDTASCDAIPREVGMLNTVLGRRLRHRSPAKRAADSRWRGAAGDRIPDPVRRHHPRRLRRQQARVGVPRGDFRRAHAPGLLERPQLDDGLRLPCRACSGQDGNGAYRTGCDSSRQRRRDSADQLIRRSQRRTGA